MKANNLVTLSASFTFPVRYPVFSSLFSVFPTDLFPLVGRLLKTTPTIDAMEKLEAKFGPRAVMSARRLQMIGSTPYLAREKAKCPFTPQREMQVKLDKIPFQH